MMEINEEIGFSKNGTPAKGCELCIKGEKLVLFITGLCGQRCFYCPVSEKKFGVDDTYANEWKTESKDDLLEEIKLTEAKGAGITGGDPLANMKKTCEYIEFLKKEKGKKFHIHLYTPLQLANVKNLKKLFEAGLDEIRFHPNIEDDKEWKRIELAQKYDWDVGVEIPCLPDKEKETHKLMKYLKGKIKFLNLNELEVSDTVVEHYNMGTYRTRDEKTYAVSESRETAEKLIEYAEKEKLEYTVYFCSAKLKDNTQMGKRIKKRAKQVAKKYDKITEEGMLIRGVIYLEELSPGFKYREKLETVDREETIKKLNKKLTILDKRYHIRKADIDEDKLRILTSTKEAKRLAKKIKKERLVAAIIEEYPTKDAIEIEIEIL